MSIFSAIKQHIMKFCVNSCTSVETLPHSTPVRNKSYGISCKKRNAYATLFHEQQQTVLST